MKIVTGELAQSPDEHMNSPSFQLVERSKGEAEMLDFVAIPNYSHGPFSCLHADLRVTAPSMLAVPLGFVFAVIAQIRFFLDPEVPYSRFLYLYYE